MVGFRQGLLEDEQRNHSRCDLGAPRLPDGSHRPRAFMVSNQGNSKALDLGLSSVTSWVTLRINHPSSLDGTWTVLGTVPGISKYSVNGHYLGSNQPLTAFGLPTPGTADTPSAPQVWPKPPSDRRWE